MLCKSTSFCSNGAFCSVPFIETAVFISSAKPSDEVEKIIKLYEHINYSKIYSFFDSNRPQDTDFYFDEFVKALKRHKNSTDNTIELEMEYKFRQAIEKASNK